MSTGKRDEWDDWDEEPEVKKEPRKRVLTTSRILIGLAAVTVLGLVVGRVFVHEGMQLSEVPPQLIGTWTCGHQEHSDLWVEFARNWITFGTGGTGNLRCEVIGANAEKVGGLDRFVVQYRDMARKRHFREILLDTAKGELRFADQPGLVWSRYD
jgi:hypothetical protein